MRELELTVAHRDEKSQTARSTALDSYHSAFPLGQMQQTWADENLTPQDDCAREDRLGGKLKADRRAKTLYRRKLRPEGVSRCERARQRCGTLDQRDLIKKIIGG